MAAVTTVTMRYMDSGDTDSGDTSGGEQLGARWSDLHRHIPLARYPMHALVWAGVQVAPARTELLPAAGVAGIGVA